MTNAGYSDRINHALAFAAKHHDQQVRKGTRAPYATHSANVAIILSRYGRSDDVVVAGILHNVISDHVSEGFSREQLQLRIASKFGEGVLQTALAVVERRTDSDGVELSQEERKEDLLDRVGEAGTESLWVYAADKLHGAGSLLAELQRTEFKDAVWERQPAGREETLRMFREAHRRLCEAQFTAPILSELGAILDRLEGITP